MMANWRPSSGPDAARRRAALIHRLRCYFENESVLEIDTPALSTAAPSDVHIESMEVHSTLGRQELYLHTSPEFCMKRLLAAGYPDIYSICRVFRDGEVGKQHQPEFTMLEWYRRGFTLNAIIHDTLRAIAAAWDDASVVASATVVDYRTAFREFAGIDPLTATTAELADASGADFTLRSAVGEQRQDWLDYLLSTQVSASFASETLTVLRHYPASQAALARICPDDTRLADRFEIFFGDTELANGYVELLDADIQLQRFETDQSERQARGRPARPIDAKLLAALESGLPACSGVAVGIERLQMTLEITDDIRTVIPFVFEG